MESFSDQTLFHLLNFLTKDDASCLQDILGQRRVKTFFNVLWSPVTSASRGVVEESFVTFANRLKPMCDGLNDITLTVMHLLSIFYAQMQRCSKIVKSSQAPTVFAHYFEVDNLNQKRLNQLNYPLAAFICAHQDDH